MTTFREWAGDVRQRLLTRLANRTFRKDPGLLDRMATLILRKLMGEAPDDPELDHPELETRPD